MLELEHIQKSFDGVPVLKDISLQVAGRRDRFHSGALWLRKDHAAEFDPWALWMLTSGRDSLRAGRT